MNTELVNKHITANVVLLLMLTILGGLSSCSVTINLLGFFGVIEEVAPGGFTSDAERVGGLIAYIWVGMWSICMILCAPIAAIGLYRQHSWARSFALGIWVLSSIGCCCSMPLCGYGIWSLSRKEVQEFLASKSQEPSAKT